MAPDRGTTAAGPSGPTLFLYRRVLRSPLPWLQHVVRAKRPLRLPVVLTRDEVRRLVGALDGTPRLVAMLLYGGGLRLIEAVRLRVQDLDAARGEVLVRAVHQRDLVDPRGVRVPLPDAPARKYPGAEREWVWRWVLPAARLYVDASGLVWRHHVHPIVVQRAVREAVRRAGLERGAAVTPCAIMPRAA